MQSFLLRIIGRARRNLAPTIVIVALVAAAVVAVPIAVTASVHLSTDARGASTSKHKPVVMGSYPVSHYASAAAKLPAGLGSALARDVHLTPAQYLANSAAAIAAVKVVAALTSAGVDILGSKMQGTELVVNVASAKDATAAEAAGATAIIGAPVTKDYSKIAFQAVSATNTYGGEPYFYQEAGQSGGSGFRCSIGFNGYAVATGAPEFVTAGHCETTMSGPAYFVTTTAPIAPGSGTNTSVGSALGNGVAGQYGGGADYGIISTSSSYAQQAGVALWGGSSSSTPPAGGTTGAPDSTTLPITGATAGIANTTLCKSGSTTGWTCGTILAIDQDVTVSGQDVNAIVASTCLLPGDSGGAAVISTGTSSFAAVGIDSGGTFGSSCSTSGGESVFFPMVSTGGSSVTGQQGSNWQLGVAVSSTATVTSPASGAVVSPTGFVTGTITGAVSGSTAILYLDGSTTPFAKADASSGSFSIPLSGVSLGSHTYTLAAGLGWSPGALVSGSFIAQYTVAPGAISTEYAAQGGASGPLGAVTGSVVSNSSSGGGQTQLFAGGSIYSSPTAGTFTMLNGVIQSTYLGAGGPSSALGWPTSEVSTFTANGGGSIQSFQNGTIVSTSTGGTDIITGAISTLYVSLGGPAGSLGPVQTNVQSFTGAGGGVGQRFLNGSVMSSPTAGAFALMNGPIRDAYFNAGGPSSVLGWPTSAGSTFTANGGGSTQTFQGGSIVVTPGGGTDFVTGAIQALSVSLGGPAGSLGPAQTGVQAFSGAGGGTGQRFVNGSIMSSPTAGTWVIMNGAIRDTYFNAGGPSSSYGWPIAEQLCSGLTCSQAFQNGMTIAPPPPDAIQQLFASLGGASGVLGAAQGAEQSFAGSGGGTGERYVNGSIMSSPTAGTFALMNGPIRDAYFNAGGPSSVLGWPTSAASTFSANGGGSTQLFQGGSIVYTATGGADIVSGAIATLSDSLGGPSGSLGPALTGVQLFSGAGGGVGQRFVNGSVMSSSTAGTFAVMNGPIRDTYFNASGPSSALGWPTSAVSSFTVNGGGTTQSFQGGSIVLTTTGGADIVSGAISTLSDSLGGASGTIGPAQSVMQTFSAAGGGAGQRFLNGSIMSSPTAGTYAVMNGGIWDAYFGAGGPSSVLGWPTSAATAFTANGGGSTQSFQGGSIVLTTTGGADIVSGAISTLSVSMGGPAGPLGPAQTGVQLFTGAGGGVGQRFLNGSIMSSTTAGTFAVMNGPMRDAYFNAGGPSSPLGWPTAAGQTFTANGGGTSQAFQGGSVVWTTTGAADIVTGAIETLSESMGGPSGTLGPAQTNVQLFTGAGGGVGQRFLNGSIMSSSTAGTFAILNGVIRDTYFNAGGPSSSYGWPTAEQVCSGAVCTQQFQSGSIHN